MKQVVLKTMLAATVLFQACAAKVYNNKAYLSQVNLEGKKVAILPVDVEFTGRLPKNMTAMKKMQFEEDESKQIQNQLYSQYLYKAKSGSRKKKAVELMNPDRVNNILSDKGISLRDSWSIDADSLGRILGADLVLKVKVKEDRIMSETASLGIGVAANVLDNLLSKRDDRTTGATGLGYAPKTYNMFLSATLSDVKSHVVVTRFSHQGDANWNRTPLEVIDAQGRKIVRKGVVYALR